MSEQLEFRVVWQREGKVQHAKRYATRKGAELRYNMLTSEAPWRLLGHEDNERVCCSGQECGCGGLTYLSSHRQLQKEMPLLYARIEARAIGEWQSLEI